MEDQEPLDAQGVLSYSERVFAPYARQLAAHIAAVKDAGLKLGLSEEFLADHDNSKWCEDEFYGYAQHFFGGGSPILFARAWLHHIHNNPHHWQYWIFADGYSPEGSGLEDGVAEMPTMYALEMIADWQGSSFVYTGSWDMRAWLQDNMKKIRLHSRTASFLRGVLSDLGYSDVLANNFFASELSTILPLGQDSGMMSSDAGSVDV
jgi:hypothetical protein